MLIYYILIRKIAVVNHYFYSPLKKEGIILYWRKNHFQQLDQQNKEIQLLNSIYNNIKYLKIRKTTY